MSISIADSQKMQRLAQEGKQISRIMAEDFPDFEYIDVYWAVYGSGQRSSQGIKRMITSRLDSLVEAGTKAERKTIVAEIDGLVCHLYGNHKENQQKLEKVRKALGE